MEKTTNRIAEDVSREFVVIVPKHVKNVIYKYVPNVQKIHVLCAIDTHVREFALNATAPNILLLARNIPVNQIFL
jgi:ribosomal protein L7Ae-like RNA K-turn-binding protein